MEKFHLSRADLHDDDPALLVGVGELDLPVDSTRPEQGGVEYINSVGDHNDLYVDGKCNQSSWLRHSNMVH